MTRTFKLTNGGITFDDDGNIEMIGEINSISVDEIAQRMSIRFGTQTRANLVHPTEGFDFYRLMLTNISNEKYNLSREALIEQEIMVTLAQDPDISAVDSGVAVAYEGNRGYRVDINYRINGGYQAELKYNGMVGIF